MEVDRSKNGSTAKTELASKVPWTDERGIALKVYNGIVLTLEIIFLLLKMTLAWFIGFYEAICPPEEKDVSGEIILVTGTGHGIGRELALQYSALGATVVCVDINTAGNEETAQLIRNANEKAKVYTFQCDVSSREAVVDLAKRVRAKVGEVSVLVNNAGIMPCRPFLAHTEEQIRATYGVNVFAHLWLLQEFLPSMISRNHGHIVALSSMAGIIGVANLVPYCGSKFAVRGIMESLHEELREDPRKLQIKITCIYPYMVDTGLCKKPKIRFPSLLHLVSPVETAKEIITSMRRNYGEVSIPNHLFYMNKICRALPLRVPLLLKDFLDTGVESHDY